jgi:glycosyltransferase involved in cell wall biosynthesis
MSAREAMSHEPRQDESPTRQPAETPVRVSVVIPTYNRLAYLMEALRSVFVQTFSDYEVIVVDDGSTDGTEAALGAYADRIRYLHQENQGAAAARNLGIGRARGEWIAFLDSDDMWEPEALERLTRATEEHPEAGLITSWGRVVDADGRPTDRIVGKRSPGPFFTPESFLEKDSGGVLTPMVRRHLLARAGGYDESLRTAHDCDLWLRLSFLTPMVAVSEPLLLRRVHDENASGDQLLNARMWLRILEKLAQDQPDFVRHHDRLYHRSLGKENLRYGREALARCRDDVDYLAQARLHLRRSLAANPWSRRAWIYLIWSYVAPTTYGGWRRRERRARAPRGS